MIALAAGAPAATVVADALMVLRAVSMVADTIVIPVTARFRTARFGTLFSFG
jgi:hypothetical protein